MKFANTAYNFIKINFVIITIILPALLSSALYASNSYFPVQWQNEIIEAINSRDSFYNSIEVPSRETLKDIWNSDGSIALTEKLNRYNGRRNIWYYYLKGIAISNNSNATSADYFNKSIQLIKGNPGNAWVLFNEFKSIDSPHWEDKSLFELERSVIKSGTLSYPFIAQELTYFAHEESKKKHYDKSAIYYKWSYHFEASNFWQDFVEGLNTLLSQPGISIEYFKSAIDTVKKSWLLQITAKYYGYKFIKAVLIFLMFSFFAVTLMEALPIAIHPTMAKFPLSISQNLKYFMSIAILFSFSIFGIIPFLLLLIIFIWPYSKKKSFLIFNIIVLLFSPLDARLMESFRSSLSVSEPIGLLRSSIYNKWSLEKEVKISEAIERNKSNHLTHLAAAILTLKKGNYESSIYHLRNAEKIAPDDPVLLTTAGTLFYLNGDEETSRVYFEKCISLYPNDPYAIFNLGQLKIKTMEAAEGSDLIAKAAQFYPNRINNFTANNAKFFNNSWPRLRQFLIPDYTAEYFHSEQFPKTYGSWQSTDDLWGISFFGISAKNSLLILPILFIMLLNYRKKTANDIVNHCKLCGKVICRKCRNGAICTVCSQAIEGTHNENIQKRIKQKIINHRRLFFKIKGLTLNLLFPGIGTLYNREKIKPTGLIFAIVTAIMYAFYFAAFTFNFNYPSVLLSNLRIFTFLIPALYSSYFFIIFLKGIRVVIIKGGSRGI